MRSRIGFVTVLLVAALLVVVILPPRGPKKIHTIGFVPPGLTSPFHVAMVDGATKEAHAQGWDIVVQAPASESDYAGFVTIVQQLLEKGVDAISINPIGVPPAVTAVKAANAKHIPIFAHNLITPFPDPDAVITSYIGYDQFTGAQHLAETTCDLLAKKYKTTADKVQGKVFILLGLDGFHAHRRTDGFKYGLQNKCPHVIVVGEQSADWLRAKGSEVATIALQKHPDIDVFYGNSDEMNIGASLAAEKLGKRIGVDIFSVGIDGNPPTLDLLAEGKVSATLGVDPFNMGVAVIKAMEKVLNGEQVPGVLLTPSVVVTQDNLADYLAGKLWTDPVAGKPELDNGLPTGAEPTAAAAADSK
jgi:ABC-type sugar transport system substrate-binding protein